MSLDNGQACLTEVQYRLLEFPDLGATWTSGFWTQAEVLWALNQRQQQFLRESGIVVGYARYDAAQGSLVQDLPTDWIRTVGLAFITTATGAYRPVLPVDSMQADFGLPGWPTVPGAPLGFSEHETESLTFRSIPAPSAAGQWELVYVALAPDVVADGSVDDQGNPTDLLTVPTEFTPYVLYGLLADLLGKVGRGQDPDRAAYCEMRYQEGVALARLLLYGGD